MHNRCMRTLLLTTSLLVLALFAGTAAFAQDPQVTGDRDGSSQQVEESDEAYRRRMELEDARRSQPTYTDPGGGYQREPEKIDKLPPESRENIRDQLVDIIMENPDWEPSDALQEYPYEPTAAAQADPSLLQQEQEAWDEQVEKYHAREAEAFGAYRGPVAGPGNPDGGKGGQQGQSGAQGQDGDGGEQGAEGGQEGGESGQAGTYEPYQAAADSAEDAVSTAGVSESALDFLRSQRAPPPGNPAAETANAGGQAQQPSQASASESSQAASQAQSEASEASEASETTAETDMRGIIAIEDLDKLEGAGVVPVAPPPEEKEDQEGEGD